MEKNGKKSAEAIGLKTEDVITMEQIQALSDYMFDVLHIKENGKIRQMNSSDPKDPTKNDTRRAYFSKSRIDALFDANPGSDGLYIYFGVHNSKIYPLTPACKSYENKLMVSLVTGKGEKPNLSEGSHADHHIGYHVGIDKGKLCPPDICAI